MEEVGANPYSAPGIVPGFLGVIIFFLGTILLVRSILKNGYHIDISRKKLVSFFKDEAVIRVFVTIIMSVMYGAVFLGRTPYVLITFLYVTAFVAIFEYRVDQPFHGQEKILLFSVIQALLVTGVVAAVFRYLFLVKLP